MDTDHTDPTSQDGHSAGARVLIVADDPLARAGLAALLSGRDGARVIGQMAAADDLAAALDVYRPDVLVWDLGWEPLHAAERLPDADDDAPPVVALLPGTEGAAEAWGAGARGLLPRDAPAGRLLAAIAAVRAGLAALDPALASVVPVARPDPPTADLTPRELDVVRLLAEGLANKAIAQRLDISEHTVKFHLNAVLGKLGAQSRTDAVVRAIRLGLIAV